MYRIKYLDHTNPEINGNKGKTWHNLKGKFATIEKAIEAYEEFKGWRTEAYPNTKFLKAMILAGNDVVKEI